MNRKFTLFTIMIFLGTSLLFSSKSYSQDGSLDPTFGTNGKIKTDIGSSEDHGTSVAIQSDGKIVVAGSSTIGTKQNFALVRYNSNGTLDPSFGTDGKITTSIGDNSDNTSAMVIQSDGKILVAGTTNYKELEQGNFALVRYNSNGTLDSSFGTGGKVVTTFTNGNSILKSLAIQSDSKIVVGGYCLTGIQIADFALARYNSDGTPDNSFDNDGKVTIPFGSGFDGCYSIAIQSDNKILAVGYNDNINGTDFAMARLNTDGTLDPSFGNGGKDTIVIGDGNNYFYSVALQKDGKIVLAGTNIIGNIRAFAIARFESNGNLDNSFGIDGLNTTSLGSSDMFFSVGLQNDGKILAAGNSFNGNGFDFALVRFKSDGTLDLSFGTDGKVATNFGDYWEFCYSLAIQADNKIVVAGYSGDGYTDDFAVARYGNTITSLQSNVGNSSLLDVFPNPTNGIITFRVNEKLWGNNYEISNPSGKTVITGKFISAHTSLNIASFPSGIYFLNVEGSTQTEFKIIKK